ncbi:methylenetetrahydrofolate reductase [Actibacterium pelagium]|uniref:Methylenetetrahydrofolate reductase n=1 Tax=Actibacterium pelagium TaxID=2029103 RepID=A0A917EP88_9RHOB|nr:hypothetical protein [Actibacterium pelagium]GGE61784.1 methylenetetrahydrofolate reductase [Actibacterium pelagium]
MKRLVSNLHYEVIPMKSLDQAISDLPRESTVSVTCSPVKGITATQEICDRLLDLGHHPIPHFAARKVESHAHTKALAEWVRSRELSDVFVVGGDAPEPAGPYARAYDFIRDFIDAGPTVRRLGVTGYPDGHPLIKADVIDEELILKATLLKEAQIDGWVSTQMCFDEGAIRSWISRIRADGVELPIHLGVAGIVDKARLMTLGTRLGIGASMRFLSRNRSAMFKLFAPGRFDPSDMVASFAADADQLGVDALHVFTFNAVDETRMWQAAILDRETSE